MKKERRRYLPGILLLVLVPLLLGLLALGNGLYSILPSFSTLGEESLFALLCGIFGILCLLLLGLSFVLALLSLLPASLYSVRNTTLFAGILFLLSVLSAVLFHSFGFAAGLLCPLSSLSLASFLLGGFLFVLSDILFLERDYLRQRRELQEAGDEVREEEARFSGREERKEALRARIEQAYREGRIGRKTRDDLLFELEEGEDA